MEQKSELNKLTKDNFLKIFELIWTNQTGEKLNKGMASSLFAHCNSLGITIEDVSKICEVIVTNYKQNKDLNPDELNTAGKKKDFLKKGMSDYLAHHSETKTLPEPVKMETNTSLPQRRMDSLARILCVNEENNPCIAVALVDGELIVAYNKPTKKDEAEIEKWIAAKAAVLQDFLTTVNSLDGIKPETGKMEVDFSVKLPSKAKEYAKEALAKLKEQGGIPNVLPKDERQRKRTTGDEHMIRSLLKIASSVINGSLSNSKPGGFNKDQVDTLLTQKEINFVTLSEASQGKIKSLGASLHAEQAIVGYLLANNPVLAKNPAEGVHIGISKLCCQACAKVLNSFKDDIKVTYRGTHDVSFPNVYDLKTEEIYKGYPTKMSTDMNPDDSGSDPEIEKEIEVNLNIEKENKRGSKKFWDTPPLLEKEMGDEILGMDAQKKIKKEIIEGKSGVEEEAKEATRNTPTSTKG